MTRGFGLCDSTDDYSTWDAAYVLGSLTEADRAEYETHLPACAACLHAVAELKDMPALLSELDSATAGDLEPPNMLPALMFEVRRRRRRSQLLAWSCRAAAVLLTVGLLVSAWTRPQPAVYVHAQPMDQVGTTALASTVTLGSRHWGTVVDLSCVCLAPVYAPHDKLAMVVIGRDGAATRLATWTADPGHTATPVGGIATPIDQIAAVQVISADNGRVLLQRVM